MAKKKKDILIPRIGKTVWKKLNPYGTDMHWRFEQLPGSYSEYIGDFLYEDENEPDPDQKIKVVMLGADYLKWLGKLEMEDCDAARHVYMEHTDDETAELLLKRNNMSTNRYLMALPLIVKFLPAFNGVLQTEYRLPVELCEKLEKAIAGLYPDSKIIVPGTICKAVDISTVNPDNWFHVIFEEKDHHPDWIVSTQDYESPFLPLAILYIPFVLEHTCRSAVFTYDEFLNCDEFHMNTYDVAETDDFEQIFDDMTELLKDSGIFEESDITVVADVPPYDAAYQHERFWLHQVYEDFVESMTDMMETEMADLDLPDPPKKFRA
ncbi:MAG: hypothetical protein IJI75_09950 [Solobacterium sp.]|nr:hypothetical protein [Solobacterium sp.]